MYHGIPRTLTLQSRQEMRTFCIRRGIRICLHRRLDRSGTADRRFMMSMV